MVAVSSFESPRESPREIVYRTRGRGRGPITRLMSPSDLGEQLKPFVFLDRIVTDGRTQPPPLEMGWHPHSGIATVTVVLDGGVRVADTTGADVSLRAGSVEWMRAGNGVWHSGTGDGGPGRAFQLWIALPPELENAASESQYVQPEEVPVVGPARVILGSYGGVTSPIRAPAMTYLQVTLAAGERFHYQPPRGHDVAWVAVMDGALSSPDRAGEIDAGEIVAFEHSERAIDFVAEGPTRFVLGSAPQHQHELFLGNYSVHTSEDALVRGEREIVRIGRELRDNGTLRHSRPAVAL